MLVVRFMDSSRSDVCEAVEIPFEDLVVRAKRRAYTTTVGGTIVIADEWYKAMCCISTASYVNDGTT
jgi:hypothetical protein